MGKEKTWLFLLIFLVVPSLGLSIGFGRSSAALEEPKERPPLILGSAIVSQKTVSLMRLYTKYSALTYCPKARLEDFSCHLCQDPDLRGTADLKAFNDSIFGMQA